MVVQGTATHAFNQITKDDIGELMDWHHPHSITITMPTVRRGPETRQNSIRLKTLLQRAEAQLEGMGLNPQQTGNLLSAGWDMVEDYEFWQHQSDGLILFISDGFFRSMRLPIDFEELVVVQNTFHVKPLLPLLTGDGRFLVLALSQNEVRLLQGTRNSVDEVSLPNEVPENLQTMLARQDVTGWRQVRFRVADYTPRETGGGDATHPMGYGVEEDEKQRIKEFFRQVDDGLTSLFEDETAPLVLAGVEYLHPLYKEANTYNNLIENGVVGNPEQMSPEELHAAAWEIVSPEFQQQRERDRARFEELQATDTTASLLSDIVPAAHYGRVDVLMIPTDIQVWGRFDEETNTVRVDIEPTPDNVDLLDLAARHTWQQSGRVYALPSQKVPGRGFVAAIMRY